MFLVQSLLYISEELVNLLQNASCLLFVCFIKKDIISDYYDGELRRLRIVSTCGRLSVTLWLYLPGEAKLKSLT